jgi:hypothetical protein
MLDRSIGNQAEANFSCGTGYQTLYSMGYKKIPNTMQENNVRLKQIPVALETILAKETNLCLTEIIYRWKHECSALSCFSCTFSFFDDH